MIYYLLRQMYEYTLNGIMLKVTVILHNDRL
jgi:hypothetical protein